MLFFLFSTHIVFVQLMIVMRIVNNSYNEARCWFIRNQLIYVWQITFAELVNLANLANVNKFCNTADSLADSFTLKAIYSSETSLLYSFFFSFFFHRYSVIIKQLNLPLGFLPRFVFFLSCQSVLLVHSHFRQVIHHRAPHFLSLFHPSLTKNHIVLWIIFMNRVEIVSFFFVFLGIFLVFWR